ncbi:distal tail protein Dit [Clostridium sp. YIM B02506]|uniref:distal tail protein Dit n=1 Tax=Clostridium sp. YIM B02506 TaxID=2910680 RepID=UPI001EEED8BC|nr:distal tail protein Dit [Clostridium sp. YIM B02506]
MVTSVFFNNKDSVLDFECYLSKRPAIPLTIEDVENIKVEGRSGTLTRRLGTYQDKIIRCNFVLLSKKDFARKVDSIAEWLNNIEDNSLIFSFDRDRIYKVKSIAISDNIEEELDYYGSFEVTFVCEPFKYPIYEPTMILESFPTTIYNNGSIYTDPYLKIYASGNITLTTNDDTITINNVNEYVELDSTFFLCKKGSTNMMNNKNGGFPQLQKGENTIGVTGSVSKIEIDIRTCYL